jgi:hypothetical protein
LVWYELIWAAFLVKILVFFFKQEFWELKVCLIYTIKNLYSSYCLKQVHSQNPLFSPKTFYLCLINDIAEISLKVDELIWAAFLVKILVFFFKQEFWELKVCLIYTIIFCNKHWSSRESVLINHRELSPFDCVLSYVICLVMYLCLLFVGLLLLLLLYSNKSIEPKLDLSLTHRSPATIWLRTDTENDIYILH